MYVIRGKAKRNYTIRGPRQRWVDRIKIDHREMEWCGMDSIDLTQDRDQLSAVMILRAS
jgi:hypothetical protein